MSEQTVHLPSLRIGGFRAFRSLDIPRLTAINLVVGHNNIGKTTFLEAISLFSHKEEGFSQLRELLENRREIDRVSGSEGPEVRWNIRRLFHQSRTDDMSQLVELGPVNDSDRTLRIYQGWIRYEEMDDGTRVREIIDPSISLTEETTDLVPALVLSYGGNRRSVELARVMESRRRFGIVRAESPPPAPCNFLSARGLSDGTVAALWDSIVLTEREQDVVNALRVIEPELERISMIDDPNTRGSARITLVKMKGRREPESLASMGDGMNRIFELALALVNSRSGIALIDELDSGVHFSVLPLLWKFVIETANRLDVQIFATTHSWDCISAFQRASKADQTCQLVRFARSKSGDLDAQLFDERELAIATREAIEVR